MPKLKNFTLLLDTSHGEILDIADPEFAPFAELLGELGLVILNNTSSKITKRLLNGVDILILGCPVNSYFSGEEIRAIVDFVTQGGCLLVLGEYGGDSLQRTNLNDITRFFGIYFEKTTIRVNNKMKSFATDVRGASTLPIITDIMEHEVTKDVRKIVIGGGCSLRTARDAMGICFTGNGTELEVYDEYLHNWIEKKDVNVPVIAAVIYGQGKVVAIGDVDFLSSNPIFGLNVLDNRKLVRNIFMWFGRPVRSELTVDWLLAQISIYRHEILTLKSYISDLYARIRRLEEQYGTSGEEEAELHDTGSAPQFGNPIKLLEDVDSVVSGLDVEETDSRYGSGYRAVENKGTEDLTEEELYGDWRFFIDNPEFTPFTDEKNKKNRKKEDEKLR